MVMKISVWIWLFKEPKFIFYRNQLDKDFQFVMALTVLWVLTAETGKTYQESLLVLHMLQLGPHLVVFLKSILINTISIIMRKSIMPNIIISITKSITTSTTTNIITNIIIKEMMKRKSLIMHQLVKEILGTKKNNQIYQSVMALMDQQKLIAKSQR